MEKSEVVPAEARMLSVLLFSLRSVTTFVASTTTVKV